MANLFNILPPNTPGKAEPFDFHVSNEELVEFRELLNLSKIGPVTWWNQQKTPEFGVSLEWLSKAKETWLTSFDWRKHEEYINKFPNFKIAIKDHEAGHVNIHFAAIFSARKDAIPIIFLHGFPASFVEFLPMMELLMEKYTPETLPYHVIVPSLPDFGLSSRSSQDTEMTLDRAAFAMNQLMLDLGFGRGYIAQGGDLGSMLARIMSVQYNECKAFHVNLLTLNPGQSVSSSSSPTPEELRIVERTEAWRQTGLAIGEKLLEWTDSREPFPLDTILSMVSFYWFTQTFPRSLYHATLVRNLLAGDPHPISMEKPLGYSLFPYDLAVLPKAWAEEIYPNLAFFRSHSKGGHFASLEQPEAFLQDVEGFVSEVSRLFGV
ncbi:hypothetical protein N7507_002687 [Penicillium longicatenatum]|nr:hypothetical protein N7507_002687 [Penicillium longicatenatum]